MPVVAGGDMSERLPPLPFPRRTKLEDTNNVGQTATDLWRNVGRAHGVVVATSTHLPGGLLAVKDCL